MQDKVAALARSEEWLAYLNMLATFRSFSVRNQVLIWLQCPHASRVTGYRGWQALGRQVRGGEKAIKIIGHSTKKITATDPDTGEETDTGRLDRWPLLSVFDISQTDGPPLAGSQLHTLPDGEGPAGAVEKLTGWLTGEGWTVTREQIPGSANGYTDHHARRIVTDTRLTPAASLAVLLHEAAHGILHGEGTDYAATRGRCETEAESSAYVLARLLGLDLDGSAVGYITGWSDADPATLAAAAGNVRHAVNTLAVALGLDEDTDTASPEPAA